MRVRNPAVQIVTQLRNLTRWWADTRPEGVCDVLLDQLLDNRPDLKEKP